VTLQVVKVKKKLENQKKENQKRLRKHQKKEQLSVNADRYVN